MGTSEASSALSWRTEPVLARFSIRTRLVALSVALLVVMAGTNLYLTRALDRSSAAAVQSDQLLALIGTVDDVRAAFADQRYWG